MIPAFLFLALTPPTADTRWVVVENGIAWNIGEGDKAHQDHIETSGQMASLILTYGVDEEGSFHRTVKVVWPMLRTIPNDTHASLQYTFRPENTPRLLIDGKDEKEQAVRFRIDGFLRAETAVRNLRIERSFFVSRSHPIAIEHVRITNRGQKAAEIRANEPTSVAIATNGVQGPYTIRASADGAKVTVPSGQSTSIAIIYSAYPQSRPVSHSINLDEELALRSEFVKDLNQKLILDTPNPVLDQMFALAKIRAAESVFKTKNGLVHSPGGSAYYSAIWANDQAEYANPFFAYLGEPTALEAASNSWAWFAKYMNPEYKPIPSSIIAEGTDFWNGAGDRGDMAMIAYGASRYALARGDKREAARQWPLIEWCLEYLSRKVTKEGVIASDSDELEGRFPAGKANLNTSCLTYDALISAAALAEELGKPLTKEYLARAAKLKAAIEGYFGATVEGFKTYRYYDGNDVLRAWIATPLTTGIFDRRDGTIDALFSPRLWTADGLASQAGEKTFWDRATLYGLRGAFAAGATERALPYLESYSTRRLLGDHVPYAVEAWPEGNQRHLSAESALYCRVFTEGLFGLRPTGLRSFEINPRLPQSWPHMALKHLMIAGSDVSIEVSRTADIVKVRVTAGGKTREFAVTGEPITLTLPL